MGIQTDGDPSLNTGQAGFYFVYEPKLSGMLRACAHFSPLDETGWAASTGMSSAYSMAWINVGVEALRKSDGVSEGFVLHDDNLLWREQALFNDLVIHNKNRSSTGVTGSVAVDTAHYYVVYGWLSAMVGGQLIEGSAYAGALLKSTLDYFFMILN